MENLVILKDIDATNNIADNQNYILYKSGSNKFFYEDNKHLLYIDIPNYYENKSKIIMKAYKWIYENTNYNYIYYSDNNINIIEDYANYDYYGNNILYDFDRTWHCDSCNNQQLNQLYYDKILIAPFADNDSGYILSRKAIKILLDNSNDIKNELYDDKAIGDVLFMNNIMLNEKNQDNYVLSKNSEIIDQLYNEQDEKYIYINNIKNSFSIKEFKNNIIYSLNLSLLNLEDNNSIDYKNEYKPIYKYNKYLKKEDNLKNLKILIDNKINILLSKESYIDYLSCKFRISYNQESDSYLNSSELLTTKSLSTQQFFSRPYGTIEFIKSFILIIDFPNFGGGATVFLNKTISYYKKYQTFLIARNFNNKIYFYINEEYLLNDGFDTNSCIKFLNNNNSKIKKIFINHTIHHSDIFIDNLFTLGKEVTIITHDFLHIFTNCQPKYDQMNYYINNKNEHSRIDINRYDQIITQNQQNLYYYNDFIKDKSKVVICDLPDYRDPDELIKTNNKKIVIGLIGNIAEIKGKNILKNISDFYKNNPNIEIVVIGTVYLYQINSTQYDNIHEFNDILKKYKPNILLELSIWHETYSFTLSLAMITQLPILYLKKNNISVIENRLSKYDKAYGFNDISELNNIIMNNNVKQDYFYTVKPIIYYNSFWDTYFNS